MVHLGWSRRSESAGSWTKKDPLRDQFPLQQRAALGGHGAAENSKLALEWQGFGAFLRLKNVWCDEGSVSATFWRQVPNLNATLELLGG